jgi:nucleoside-diphosphate-sugar epimerase
MRILVTGGCGGIGKVLTTRLVEEGHEVRVFALPKRKNKRFASMHREMEFFWGDIVNFDQVRNAVKGTDAVIHLAFIIPPGSEDNPDIAQRVNIGGTRNVIRAMKEANPNPKLVFTSSVIVFGMTNDEKPPITIDHPVRATDNYSNHKIEVEEMIRESELDYVILRISDSPWLDIWKVFQHFRLIYDIPLDQRVEFVHVKDVATACLNAVTTEKADGKTLIISGDEKNRMYFREEVENILGSFGLKPPPKEKFTKKPYYLDWYDTDESQRLLNYQERTVDDYIMDLKEILGFKSSLAKLFSPFIRIFY